MRSMKLVLLAITTCAIFSKVGLCETRPESIPIVENPISFGWGKPLDWESGTGGYVPVYAKFWFKELPSFKRTVTLNLSFQARYDLKESITIERLGSEEAFDIEPTEIIWQGPIQKGDIFETSFNLRCWEIGRYFLTVILIYEGRNLFDYSVMWILDSNDNVYHLSSRGLLIEDEEPNRIPLRYLKDDMVIRYGHSFDYIKNQEGFQSMITIRPIPRVEDTVDVIYWAKAARDFPNGVQLRLDATSNLQVIEIPKNWIGGIKKNEVYEGVLRVVFKTPGESFLMIKGSGDSIDSTEGSIKHHINWSEIHFQFGDDGKLLYAGRKDKHWYHPEQMAGTKGSQTHLPDTRTYYFEPRIKSDKEQGFKK